MSGGSGLVSPRSGQETEPAGQEVLLSSPPPVSKDGGEADQSAEPERDDTGGSASASDAVFETLVKDLRNALGDKAGKGKVWLPESERKSFRIMLVDKVFPPGGNHHDGTDNPGGSATDTEGQFDRAEQLAKSRSLHASLAFIPLDTQLALFPGRSDRSCLDTETCRACAFGICAVSPAV